ASEAAVQGIALGLVVAALVASLGITLAPRLLAVMGASPAVTAIGTGYTRTMLGGSATVLLLFLINAIFRGAGDAAIAMRVLWLANSINILLGPCLIFGLGPFPRLGVTGAAVATTIGRGTGVLYQLYRLTRGDARVAVRRAHLALRPAVMAMLLRLSGSGTFQVLVGTASYIGLVRIMSSFGSAALAGYTIAIRILIFALLPSWGLSNAAATMVGQSLGAGKPERAERAAWLAGGYNMVVLGTVGVLFILLAGPIVGLFTHDPVAWPTGAVGLRRRSPPTARGAAAGRSIAPRRAVAGGDARTGGRPAGGGRNVPGGRRAAAGLPGPPARRRGRAGSRRAARADPLARARDGAADRPCLHSVLHLDQRRGAGPSGAALATGRSRRGAARIGALVAAPRARGRPGGRGGGARPGVARC